MRVISNKRLVDAGKSNKSLDTALQAWRRIIEHSEPKNFSELRKVLGSVDVVGDYVVFDIKGNDWRLVCWIDYRSQLCYVKHVMTHKEYDRGKWK